MIASGWAVRDKQHIYDNLLARDKTILDPLWLKDDLLEDSKKLLAPEVLAQEIVALLEPSLG